MKTLQPKHFPLRHSQFFKSSVRLLSSLGFTVLISLYLSFNASPLYANDKDNKARIEKILNQYREPQKTQLHQAIKLTTQRHSGQVLNASIQSNSEEKHYQIKMLLNNGHMKTFYVDKDIRQISQ